MESYTPSARCWIVQSSSALFADFVFESRFATAEPSRFFAWVGEDVSPTLTYISWSHECKVEKNNSCSIWLFARFNRRTSVP
jgi:hypothetical protein